MKHSNSENYMDLLKKAESRMNPVFAHLIEKDLIRTFSNHPAYRHKVTINSLRNILKAYTLQNSIIGYCQSMNYIVGTLLMIMEEEAAFHMLCLIVEKLFPEYYIRTMVGLQIDQWVLKKLIDSKLPRIAKHFEKCQMDISLNSTRWFMCLYTTIFPFPTVLRIWDIMFCRGSATIPLIGYCVLKIYEKEILQLNDFGSISKFLDKTCASMYNWQLLLNQLNSFTTPTFAKIEKLRTKSRTQIESRISAC